MAEVKNSFLASKMNKDLDDRLIPSNEYRNALNVAVSESEDSDVGALENVIGNTAITSLGVSLGYPGFNAKAIGVFTDDNTDSIYIFFTDFTDTSASRLTNRPTPPPALQPQPGGNLCSIVRFNTNTIPAAYETLVTGVFLNFSTTHPIYGVNLVENQLFWTDNRNQPRKINVDKPLGYYINEDQISVAKYAPWQPISVVKEVSAGVYEGTMVDASSPGAIGSTVGIVTSNVVASNAVSVQVIQGEFENGQTVTGAGIPAGTTIQTTGGLNNETLVLSANVTIDKGENILVGLANPNYISNYAGDPNFLQDKFVRFSYRFKFDDNEYSIIAPFTQATFIPNQDGYFLQGDEEDTWLSSSVAFMDNKVDLVDLIIPFPQGMTAGSIGGDLKIKEIDIIYKESDGLSLMVVDTITLNQIENTTSSNTFYEYNYQSTKPILTLPGSEITRVYDKTPVKALGQEISGNRVIYGNFQNKHTAPNNLSYQVTASQKTESGTSYTGLDKEYPYHTLKRNRNYQVGIVLADRYGRQSDVILSNSVVNNTSNDIYGASTFYWPYRDLTAFNDVEDDNGNSIKILFEEPIVSNYEPLTPLLPNQSGEPGLYSSSNVTGWYSYKVVVKQTEQDYYNVYNPGIFSGSVKPVASSTNSAYTTLISDNINKVPKDLQDVSADQAQFNSDTKLFCVVDTPDPSIGSNSQFSYNVQGYPLDFQNVVSTISTIKDYGADTVDYTSVLQVDSNPYLAQLQTPFLLGRPMVDALTDISLGVFETDPVISNLDIYYETTTTGLISDLNTLIVNSEGNIPNDFTSLDYDHFENQNPSGTATGTGEANSPYVTDAFRPVNAAGTQILKSEITSFIARSNSNTVQRAFEIDGVAQPGVQDFQLETTTDTGTLDVTYKIKILQPFYFGPNSNVLEGYTFTFQVRNTDDNSTADVNGAVASSATISVDSVATELFTGMEVYNGSTLLGTIQSITVQPSPGTTATFVLSNSISIANGTSLIFKAPLITLIQTGVLQNSNPIITASSLIALNSPEYSTMPSPYFNLTGVNGSFDTTKNQNDLNWAFTGETSQDATNSYKVITNSSLSTSAEFFLNKTTGVLGLQSGELSKTYTISVVLADISLTDTASVTILGTPGAFTDGFSTAFDI